jgi:hypothetical protein
MHLVLATRAEMRPATGKEDSADRGSARMARLPGTEVNVVLQLEEAAFTVGIDIV